MKNPLFKSGIKSGTHHLGGVGEIKRIRLRDIHSPQQTVDEKKVRKLARFTKNMPGTPTVSHAGRGKYVLKDGNHRVNAALRQGKRVIDVRVQKLDSKEPLILFTAASKILRKMIDSGINVTHGADRLSRNAAGKLTKTKIPWRERAQRAVPGEENLTGNTIQHGRGTPFSTFAHEAGHADDFYGSAEGLARAQKFDNLTTAHASNQKWYKPEQAPSGEFSRVVRENERQANKSAERMLTEGGATPEYLQRFRNERAAPLNSYRNAYGVSAPRSASAVPPTAARPAAAAPSNPASPPGNPSNPPGNPGSPTANQPAQPAQPAQPPQPPKRGYGGAMAIGAGALGVGALGVAAASQGPTDDYRKRQQLSSTSPLIQLSTRALREAAAGRLPLSGLEKLKGTWKAERLVKRVGQGGTQNADLVLHPDHGIAIRKSARAGITSREEVSSHAEKMMEAQKETGTSGGFAKVFDVQPKGLSYHEYVPGETQARSKWGTGTWIKKEMERLKARGPDHKRLFKPTEKDTAALERLKKKEPGGSWTNPIGDVIYAREQRLTKASRKLSHTEVPRTAEQKAMIEHLKKKGMHASDLTRRNMINGKAVDYQVESEGGSRLPTRWSSAADNPEYSVFRERKKSFSSPSPLIQFMHCTAEAVPRADIPRKIVKRKIIKKPIQFAAFDMYRTWMDPIDKSSPGRKDRRALQDAAGRSVDLPASKPPRVPSGGIGRSLSQERIEKKIQQGAAREVADQMEGIRDHPGVGAPSTEGELARHKKAMQGPELYHPENEVKSSVIHTRNKPAPVEAWKHRDPKAWLVANKAQGRHADLDPENMTAMQKVSMRKEAQTFRDTEAKTLRSLRGRIQEMRKAVSPGFKPSENFKPSSVSNNIVGGMKPEKWEPKGRLRIGPGLSTPEMVHGAISYVDQKAGDRISTVKSRLRRMEGTLKTRVGETTGMPEGPARHAKVKGYLEGMISSEGPTAMDLTKKIDPTRSDRIQKAMSRPGREWNPERVERSRRAIAKLEHQANSAEYLSQVRQGVVKKMVATPKVSALPDGYVPGAALKKLGRIAGATALVGAGAYGIRKYLNRSKEEPKQMKMSARGRIIQFVVPRQVKQIRKAILTAREPAKRWRASAFADHVMSESEKRGGTAQRFFPNLYSNLPPKTYKVFGRPVDAQRMAREQSRAGHEEKLIQRLVEQGKIVRTGNPIPKEAFTNYPVNAIGKLPTVEEVMSQDIVGDVSSRVSNQFAKHAGAARAVVAEERRMPLAIIQHTPSPLADKIAATERRAVEAEGLVGGLRASVASSKKAAAESTSRHAEEMKRQVFRGDRNLLIGAGAAGAAGIGGGYLIGRKKKEVQFSEKKRELTPWQKVGISAAASGAVLGAIPAFRHGSTFRGVAKSIGTGAGIGSIIGGGGTYVGTKILGEPRRDDPIGTTKRAAVGGAIAGLGLGAAGAIALRRGHFKNAMQDWRPVTFIRRTAAPVAIATGAGAGALIAGSHAADEGQQVDTMRNLKKSIRMSSKLKPIRFAIEAPLSGKLAADRYRKKIADDDFDRRDANVLRSSGAGAVLGGMLGGRRGALAGAGLGAASVLGIRQATKSGKDMYGERSRGAKQAEGLPWKIAAIGAAGLSGRSMYNKLKSLRGTTLSRKGGLIEFRDWSDKWVGDNVNYTARGEDVNRWGGRGGRLVRDIGRKARGEEHKDSRGRVQTPEWQKPWAKKAMLIGGVGLALGAGVLTRGKLKGLAQEAKASYGVNQVPRPAARFAHNVMEGNVSHSVKNRIGAFVPGPVKRGYQKVKGFFSNVARDVEHKAASKLDKINEAVENESNMVVTAKGNIHNARKVNAAVAEQEKALNQANVIAGNAKEKIRVMRSPEEAAAEELHNTIHGKPRTFLSSNEKPIRFDAWDIKERSRNTAIVRTSDYNKTRKEREHTRMSKSTGYLLRDLGIAAAGGIGLWAGHRRGFAKAAGSAAGTRPLISPAARAIEEAPPPMWIRQPIQAYQSMSQIIHLNNQLDNLLT